MKMCTVSNAVATSNGDAQKIMTYDKYVSLCNTDGVPSPLLGGLGNLPCVYIRLDSNFHSQVQ
jgi:hypothetical protein